MMTSVTIPSEIEGKPVTTIAERAFVLKVQIAESDITG